MRSADCYQKSMECLLYSFILKHNKKSIECLLYMYRTRSSTQDAAKTLKKHYCQVTPGVPAELANERMKSNDDFFSSAPHVAHKLLLPMVLVSAPLDRPTARVYRR